MQFLGLSEDCDLQESHFCALFASSLFCVMAWIYLGGSGELLIIRISLSASTVFIFYGYDQVSILSGSLMEAENIDSSRESWGMSWLVTTFSKLWEILRVFKEI